MPVQISYNQQDKYQAGVINGVAPHTITTTIAAQEIQFGFPIDKDGNIALGAEQIFGIACAQASVEAAYPYVPNESYIPEQAVGVLRRGEIAVKVTDTPAIAGGAVFTNDSFGEFAGSTSTTGFTQALNCVYMTSAEVGEFAMVKINFAGVSTTPPPPASTATGTAIIDDALNTVTSISLDDGGSGYAAFGTTGVTLGPPDAVQAVLGNYDNSNADGSGSVNITSGGQGYGTTLVSVIQDGGTGVGAAFTATITDGVVTAVTGDGNGSGYDGTETFSITIPNVVQAEAEASVLGGAVISFTVTEAGEGYANAPTVTVDAP